MGDPIAENPPECLGRTKYGRMQIPRVCWLRSTKLRFHAIRTANFVSDERIHFPSTNKLGS